MKAASAILVLLAGCASAPDGATVKLTPEQVDLCNTQGGCAMLTARAIALLQRQALAAGRQTCGKEQAL